MYGDLLHQTIKQYCLVAIIQFMYMIINEMSSFSNNQFYLYGWIILRA